MPTAILRETVWTALRSRIDFSLSQRICRQIWGRIAHPTMYGDMMASRASFKAENQAFLGWLRRRGWDRPRTWLAPPWVIWALLVVVLAYWVLRNVPAFSWLAP